MIKKIEDNLREFVYGGMDGAVTTFAIVTGAAGAGLGNGIILIVGISSVLADGFSMAVGAYLSEKADQQLEAKNAGTDQDVDDTPLTASIATFISFLLVGVVPLLVYVVDYAFDLNLGDDALPYSIGLTLIAFAAIGYLRGVITKIDRVKSVIEVAGLGLAAAVIAYLVGGFVERLIS